MTLPVRYISVVKNDAIFSFVIIEFFFGWPIILIESLDLPLNLTIFFTIAFLGLFYIPVSLFFFERVRRSAVVINITLEALSILKYGASIDLSWHDIKSVKTEEKIFTGKYGRIAGVRIETNLPSNRFIKTTLDVFIPDLFDVNKEELAKQIVARMHNA